MNGLAIKEILGRIGVSQREIADLLDMSTQNLSAALSKDDIKTSLVERIANAVGKPISFFYGESSPSAVNTGTNNGNIAGRDITDSTQLAELHSIIAQQQKTISELSATIAKLVK